MKISAIVCVDKYFGISKNNNIPWLYINDLKMFKNITIHNIKSFELIKKNVNKQNVVIMSKKTYLDIPHMFRPLIDRINVVLTSDMNFNDKQNDKIIIKHNMRDLLMFLENNKKTINEVYVIGGNTLYSQFLDMQLINKFYITQIDKNYECDNIFPYNKVINNSKFKINNSNIIYDINKKNTVNNTNQDKLIFIEYDYYNKEENNFLNSIQKIINKGVYNLDRTKVGTLSLFGKSFKYNIRNYRFPLFTHRKMFVRGIIEELLFFISGSPDTKILENKNVNIWKGNTSREFLDNNNLSHFREGEYGESYGFNLRHYGAEYKGPDYDYTNTGYDQLQNVINLIKNNPTSRRIMFVYHNPDTMNRIPLPACHVLYQFNVDTNKNELSCSFYQRSSDSILAGGYNVCSAALLVFMICKLTNLNPGKIIHNIGNIHIYMNQIEETKKILENKPLNFPICYIDDTDIKTIDDFKYENFKILLYNSYKKYKLPMAI